MKMQMKKNEYENIQKRKVHPKDECTAILLAMKFLPKDLGYALTF